MTLLVGLDPGRTADPALELAMMLARSAETDLVIGVIIGRSWVPSMARIDEEWQDYSRRLADVAVQRAREFLGDEVPARFVVHQASSPRRGLAELAEQYECSMIVVGSAGDGPVGRTSLGSVSDALLHSSKVPVAVAPTRFTAPPGAKVTRVTAAYGGSAAGADLVVGAAGVTAAVGATLRLAAFAVRPASEFTVQAGVGPQDPVLREWIAQIEAHATEVLDEVATLPSRPTVAHTTVGIGSTWAEALADVEWTDTDVLVIGSSSHGPLARVFLGSHAIKVARNAPVPAIVVPRLAGAELADRAHE